MGLRRDSLGARVFALIMSLVLVMGLIPTSAFAEAAAEMTASEEQPTAATSQGNDAKGSADAGVDKEQPDGEGRQADEEQLSDAPDGEGAGKESGNAAPSTDGNAADAMGTEDTVEKNDTQKGAEQPADAPDGAGANKESGNAAPSTNGNAADAMGTEDTIEKNDAQKGNGQDASMPAFKAEQVVDGVKVAVRAQEGVFPAGAKLSVKKATRSQEQQVGEAVEEERVEGANVAESHTLDVKVLDADGNEVQPAKNQKVEVSFTCAEVADKNLTTQVYHVTEDEATGELVAQSLNVDTKATPETSEKTTATVQTDGFSLYTVEFTYGNLQYVMPGDSEVPLSTILATVGLTGEVTAAEVSNDELFSVSNEKGEWVVAAHQAFGTTEWLKVTINDVTYSITVTDEETKTVAYIERHWDGTKVVSEEKTRDDVKTFPYSGAVFPGGWYLVDGGRDFTKRICFTGDTHIILGSSWDVFKLGWLRTVGIYISEGCTLSIYCQSEKYGSLAGHLDVSGVENGAGIGGYPGHTGGDVVIHGGIINVTGAKNCAGIGSNDGQGHTGSLTVYGGHVRAKGGENGAGIGGGRGCDGGNVTIYEGAFSPEGGNNAAGIGGGKGGNGGTVTIHGGTIQRPQITYDPTVYYNGGDNGAGIGGGQGGNAGTITIDGGNVSVFAKNNGAGIGCGDAGKGGSVTINGGTVNATGGDDGAGIGGGEDGYCDVTINGGMVTANGGRQAAAIGGGNNSNGGNIVITGGKVTANADSTRGRGIGSGYDSNDSTPIFLSYTDATRDGIRITTSSYNGDVTLDQPFKNANGFYAVGSSPDLKKMAGSTLKAWDTQEETWAQLQERINSAQDGDTITLQQSYEALNSDSRLTFDGDISKSLTIDLNGYTLNRAMQESTGGGSVIYVGKYYSLTIADSAGGGIITGGKATNGGGIYCTGSLTLNGGTIKGNTASSNGGGIYLDPDGSGAILNGGAITGNTCGANGNGGGVYAGTPVWVSGNPQVSGNKKGDDKNNLWLKSDKIIHVLGVLTEGANLSVLSEVAGKITDGYGQKNGATPADTYFSADDAKYAPFLQDDEVWIQEVTYTQETASYVERSWNGTSVVETNQTTNAFVVPDSANMTGGWYYLNKDVTANKHIMLNDNTNLILGDGYTLTVKGIYIPQGKTLNIYAQAGGTGKLVSKASSGAGIGATSDNHPGGNIFIHGGVVEATGDDNCAGIGSNAGNKTTSPITIYGGTVTAKGGDNGAGIGGGDGCDGGTINVYGGIVTATGGDDGAGIGGGDDGDGGAINVYGGTVTVKGGKNGAGIGGGNEADGGNIFIVGGTITANENPEEDGAAIGGGDGGDGGTITISGGTINAWSRDGACIGGGDDGDGGKITINEGVINCYDKGSAQGARIGGGCDGDGGEITINYGHIHTYNRDGAGIGGGEDGDSGTITINGGLVQADYAEGGQGNGAGIGGGNHRGDGELITINGGQVYANAKNGAGIGGGRQDSAWHWSDHPSGDGGTITITGGEVVATSEYGFGIGAGGSAGGNYGSSSIGDAGTITISGNANVTATGNQAGIGGDDGSINIQGGTVTAKGEGADGEHGRGILLRDTDGRVTISGGTVNVYGYRDNPGLSTEWATVKITGGKVNASAEEACALGGKAKDASNDGKLIIEGARTVVHASSSKFIAVGGFKKSVYGPGITVEMVSGGRDEAESYYDDAKIDYKGMKVIAGTNEESATILPENVDLEHHGEVNAHNAYNEKSFKYLRYEPCDHKGLNDESLIDEGVCWACGHVAADELKYVECSWDDTTNKVVKTEKDLPAGWQEFPGNDNDEKIELSAGCYVVSRNLTVSKIELKGDTSLVLCDGYTLSATTGLHVPEGCTLNIYPQGGGTGRLVATGLAIAVRPGIYNLGSVVVHGGVVTAEGNAKCAGIGSNDGDCEKTGSFTMYDGTVTATGGRWAAGIGGGRGSDGGVIKIYGGTVTATGKDSSAGIGGGDPDDMRPDTSTIEIYGGTVTANGDSKGAGIGGGEYGNATIKIYDGNVYATGGKSGGAGIGSGASGAGSDITITGGAISSLCSSGGNGIGDGKSTPDSSSTITLGYTDKTKEEISITATSFDGTVTLEQPFYNANGLFRANETPNVGALGGSTLRAWDGVTATTWKDLQNLINGADGGQVIKLGQDFVAEEGDATLQVASGKTITIDLNGHTLDRNLAETDFGSGGSVLYVQQGASLTIEDSKGGGVITGGNNHGNGGGINCEGTLTINGGTIQGNKTSWWGGGIYLADDTGATLHLNGGTITGNACHSLNYYMASAYAGGGVHVSGSATMTISGAPVVTGNTKGTGDNAIDNNLTLAHGAQIKVTGELEGGANVGVTILPASGDPIGTFTSEYGKYNEQLPGTYFHSDNGQYSVVTASVDGYTEGRVDTAVRGVTYLSYEWADGKLSETVESTEGNWMAWPDGKSIPGGMYVLNKDVTIKDRVSLEDDTWIVLCDGCTLDVKGLYVPRGKTLTIYGQIEGSGAIKSKPDGGAAIGAYGDGHKGGNVVIQGGTITATGHKNCAGIGSNDGNGSDVGSFTMYHGTVVATGGANGAGIGGGRNCDGGEITIYGGTVTATGKDSSAGIGGGDPDGNRVDTSTINIYGGTITATGNSKGAGIGGGEYGHATINISGGTVTATGGSSGGAGIGSGVDGTGSTVTISGGVVTALCYTGGHGIGDGKNSSDSTVTIDYTDATKDTIGVTAASFGGTVTLQKPFMRLDDSSYFYKGTVSEANKERMAGGTIRAWDGAITNWKLLQHALNTVGDGGTIKLEHDITAEADDKWLEVAKETSCTLDLNGHTIDRGLKNKDAQNDGYVMFNSGKLTIIDSSAAGSGKMTGGNRIGVGGCICNDGTLTLLSGAIAENVTTGSGGGIYNLSDGVLNMLGGAIRGNHANNRGGGIYNRGVLNLSSCEISADEASSIAGAQTSYGGGIYNDDGGKLNLSGKLCVTGNPDSNGNDIYLHNSKASIVGSLETEEPIGIYTEASGAFTKGLFGNGMATNFTSNRPGYAVRLDAQGEAQLLALHTVSVVNGIENGEVTISTDNACAGDTVTVTANPSDAHVVDTLSYSYRSGGQDVTATIEEKEGTYSFVMPDADATVNGTFKTAPPDHAHDGSTLVHHDAVVPTYDPATDTYTDGNIAYYTCSQCGACFVEGSDGLVRKDESELILPYFRFRSVTVAGYELCDILEYNGQDASVTIPETVPAGYMDATQVGRTVTGIDSEAFKDKTFLTNVTIGDSPYGIYESAFEGCTSLRTVTVGSGLSHIGAGAFKNCSALESFSSSSTKVIDYFYQSSDQEDSFGASSGIRFSGPHGSGLLAAARDFGGTFVPTDRHQEPTWAWAADYTSATATFDCQGTCEFNGGVNAQFTDADITSTVSNEGTSYTAEVDVDGNTYTDTVTSESLTLNITDWNGQAIEGIRAAKDDTIATVKRRIAAKTGYPVERQVLLSNDSELEDDKTLEGCGITNENHLLELLIDPYTITWNNDDGTLIDTTQEIHGQMPTHANPVKVASAEYTYTFAGWTPTIEAATKDTTYTATFTSNVKRFSLNLRTMNGGTLSIPVAATDTIAAVKEAVTAVAGYPVGIQTLLNYDLTQLEDTLVLAQQGINEQSTVYLLLAPYTITWKNDDGSVIDTTGVLHGDMPTHADATKPEDNGHAYVFAGWDPKVVAATGDAEYQATYTSVARITGVSVDSNDAKTTYNQGDALDVTGLKLNVSRYDDTTETVDVTADMVSGFDGNKVGEQTLTVTYQGRTATYDIRVLPPTEYTLTVENGTGGGNYVAGESVTITANVPDGGKRFKEWTGADGLTFTSGSASTVTATFSMPAAAVTVTATYEDIPAAARRLTFYEDAAGTRVWRQEALDIGTSLGAYESYGTEEPNLLQRDGYTLAGWATEPDVVVDSYKTKEGDLNPALEGKLVDFDAAMADDVDAYPIWIRDRLEVHLVAGGGDGTPVTMGTGANGKEQATEFTVNIDEKIQMTGLDSTTRVGYDLGGWFTQGGVSWNGDWGVTPEYCDKDESGQPIVQTNAERRFKYYTVTLTALWTPKKVGVAYDVGEGSGNITDANTYGLGDAITVAAAPTPVQGKTFVGWENSLGDLYSPDSSMSFSDWSLVGDNGEITFTAQYAENAEVALNFDAKGGTAVAPLVGYKGNIVNLADSRFSTTRAGYDFDGWYNVAGAKCAGAYTFTTRETLYAQWKVQQHTITFDSAGGSEVDPITQDYGSVVAVPEDPTRGHYDFAGWHPEVPATMPSQDTTVTAAWTPARYTIKFDAAGGSPVATIEDVYGASVTAPANPTKQNSVFAGWQDKDGNAVTFPMYMPDTYPTYTAKWKSVPAKPNITAEAVDAYTVRVKNPVSGAEYVIVPTGQTPTAKDWASARRAGTDGGVVFGNLSPATSYDVWGRIVETEDAVTSEAANATVVTPALLTPTSPPAKPTVWATNDTTVAVREGSDAQEYALVPKGSDAPAADSDAWKSPDANGKVEWTGLAPNTEYDVYARMKGTDTTEVSGPSQATTVKTPPAAVTGVKLNSGSAKKAYNQGDALDVRGLTLEVTRSDGSKETIAVTANMVSGFDSSKVGKQTLTITHEGHTDTYEVEIKAATPTPKPTPAPDPTPTKRFPDVLEGSWYYGVVYRAAGLGLINGYENGNFGPNDNVTRGQVAVILWNMAGKPGPKGTPKAFPDVATGKYYYAAVRWASSVGVVNGYKNGRFGPDDLVPREQLAAMLANYAGKVADKDTSGSAADYKSMKDASKVSGWASRSVGWCFRSKILSGTKDGRINPQDNATRAETAKMVVFLHDLL